MNNHVTVLGLQLHPLILMHMKARTTWRTHYYELYFSSYLYTSSGLSNGK